MFVRKVVVALSLVLGAYGCLEARKVLTPGSVDDSGESSATLSLPRTALANLETAPTQLVIHVYKVEGGKTATTELRPAYEFTITDVGLYPLAGLPLGEIEFQVFLLDDAKQSVAEGSLRAVIGLGAQTLPQLILKPKTPVAVDVDLKIALNLVNFPGALAEPAEVRQILGPKCQGCHNAGTRPSAGLNLAVFPYKNTSNQTVVEILSKVVGRISKPADDAQIMPPSGPLDAAKVAIVNNFLQLAINTPTDLQWVKDVRISLALGGPGRFETSLVLKDGAYVLTDRLNLTAGARYLYNLTVFGPGNSKLLEAVNQELAVPLDGKVQRTIDITYQAPVVTLPVIVGSGDN